MKKIIVALLLLCMGFAQGAFLQEDTRRLLQFLEELEENENKKNNNSYTARKVSDSEEIIECTAFIRLCTIYHYKDDIIAPQCKIMVEHMIESLKSGKLPKDSADRIENMIFKMLAHAHHIHFKQQQKK